MGAPVVIADEITAAGYRLGGARTIVPDSRSLAQEFDAACESSELVLITAELAARLPADRLSAALLGARPLVVVVPDAGRRTEPPDLAHELRVVLGVDT